MAGWVTGRVMASVWGVVAEALVVAGLVGRGRRGRVEAERDWLVLGWIARFRFVDARVLAWRFGVSLRRVNARVSRLEAAGWWAVSLRVEAWPDAPAALRAQIATALATGRTG